ncbi:MAG: hypothetical protein HYS98_07960 [Deltaproteobacteria bacterium]|nr:hypothetical protein [Deltaproteobacteria bacterium]
MSQLRILNIVLNNRKKELTLTYSNKKKITVHYGQIGIISNLRNATVDPESSGHAFVLEKEDGKREFVPYDVPLLLSKDPDYLYQTEIEELIADIKLKMREKGISKKYLARQLKTSDMQVERLLNPNIINKNFEQLHYIAYILGMNLYFEMKKAA